MNIKTLSRRCWMLGLVAAVCLPGCDKGKASTDRSKNPATAESKGPLLVSVVVPKTAQSGEIIMGSVVANREIFITPAASGRLLKLHAALGDYVEANAWNEGELKRAEERLELRRQMDEVERQSVQRMLESR